MFATLGYAVCVEMMTNAVGVEMMTKRRKIKWQRGDYAMIVDRFNRRILKEVAKITGINDDDVELGSYVSEDYLISLLEDLVCEIEILKEEIENP